MGIGLYPYQVDAVSKMSNGSILCGDVGTGKSRTALAYYYFKECEAESVINKNGPVGPMLAPRDLYIITTAKKRDSKEWLEELAPFCLTSDPDLNYNGVTVTIDSWNNIAKYKNVVGAFFIFDEQRVVGSGPWVRAFLNITRKNKWVLLSATPGDKWTDYIPVFVAHGFYKNKTEFLKRHAVYNPYITKYPKIDKFTDTGRLIRFRNAVLVKMKNIKETVRLKHDVVVDYDKEKYDIVYKQRWNPYEQEPIEEIGKLCYLMRRVTNEDASRENKVEEILSEKSTAIIFYNFNYELEMLRAMCKRNRIPFSEWNGNRHQKILEGKRWVYLVQYLAGSEGWNCITTDTIIFYSQNYSYRNMEQAAGRIDRINTPFKELHYYYLRSKSPIDVAITKALKEKRNFNERSFLGQ